MDNPEVNEINNKSSLISYLLIEVTRRFVDVPIEFVGVGRILSLFFLNIFQDCIQPFGHEMLSWVRLRDINAHSVSPPAR